MVIADFFAVKFAKAREIPQFYWMKRAKWLSNLVLILLAGLSGRLAAKVSLPAFFSDHMVLQAGAYAPVWGRAAPGEQVIVSGSWDGASLLTYADSRGRWRVDLGTPAPGGPYTLTVQGPENTLLIRDVLVGEVWLASGAMDHRLADTGGSEGSGTLPQIRLFRIQPDMALSPRFDLKGRWEICTPAAAAAFSAVAYHFGRALRDSLRVPVGLIEANYPRTPAHAWISRPSLEADPAFAHLLQAYDADLRAQRAGLDSDRTPLLPIYPTVLYNAMIAPLAPLAMQGVLWYQGEVHATDPYLYRRLLPALIQDWRQQWGWRFAFYAVQSAPYAYAQAGGGAGLREAQYQALSLPNTGLVVTLDLGEAGHPQPRQAAVIGHRLARWALAHNYERTTLPHTGPLPGAPIIEGARLGLPFRQTAGGLDWRPSPGQFRVAGADRHFWPATVAPQGDTLWLSHPAVSAPVAARYAFADTALATLFDGVGLPAPSFRTDDWPRFYQPPALEAPYDRAEKAFVLTCTYRHPQQPRLHYRLDGQPPDSTDRRYTGPLVVPHSARVRVRAYAGGAADPQVVALDLRRHEALTARIVALNTPPGGYVDPLARRLLDGVMGGPAPFDGRWFAIKREDMSVVVDLGKKMTLDSAGLRCLWHPATAAGLPRSLRLATSSNGRRYKEGPTLRPGTAPEQPGVVPFAFALGGRKARYLRLTLENPGPVPAGLPQAGEASWLYVDEIWVE